MQYIFLQPETLLSLFRRIMFCRDGKLSTLHHFSYLKSIKTFQAFFIKSYSCRLFIRHHENKRPLWCYQLFSWLSLSSWLCLLSYSLKLVFEWHPPIGCQLFRAIMPLWFTEQTADSQSRSICCCTMQGKAWHGSCVYDMILLFPGNSSQSFLTEEPRATFP